MITHWEEMKKVWHHALYKDLEVKPEEYHVFIAVTKIEYGQRIAQTMF